MEQKRFDKRNLIVIGVLLALIAVAGVIALIQRKPLQTEITEDTRAFLMVEVAGKKYEPIELIEDGRYTITRGDMVNEIAVTKNSVTMHASTCDNQDCVLQGTVSLENRDNRVLQNMILCLPNEVVLRLYTEEEVAALLLDMAGYTGEDADE